jgi:hypothetical protein
MFKFWTLNVSILQLHYVVEALTHFIYVVYIYKMKKIKSIITL